jgi:hypothetical protein
VGVLKKTSFIDGTSYEYASDRVPAACAPTVMSRRFVDATPAVVWHSTAVSDAQDVDRAAEAPTRAAIENETAPNELPTSSTTRTPAVGRFRKLTLGRGTSTAPFGIIAVRFAPLPPAALIAGGEAGKNPEPWSVTTMDVMSPLAPTWNVAWRPAPVHAATHVAEMAPGVYLLRVQG